MLCTGFLKALFLLLGAFNVFCRTLPYSVFVSLTQTVQVYANVTKIEAEKVCDKFFVCLLCRFLLMKGSA